MTAPVSRLPVGTDADQGLVSRCVAVSYSGLSYGGTGL
jgi:hypothetical protein